MLLKPLAQKTYETEDFPVELFQQMGELGYLCISYPEKYEAEIKKLRLEGTVLRGEAKGVKINIDSDNFDNALLNDNPCSVEDAKKIFEKYSKLIELSRSLLKDVITKKMRARFEKKRAETVGKLLDE